MATVHNFTASFEIVNTEALPWSHYALQLIKWVLSLILLIFIPSPPKKRKAKRAEMRSITPEPRSILLNLPDETRVILIA